VLDEDRGRLVDEGSGGKLLEEDSEWWVDEGSERPLEEGRIGNDGALVDPLEPLGPTEETGALEK
jgi:hypothetical protein